LIDGDGWISPRKNGQVILGFCSPQKLHVDCVVRFLGLNSNVVFKKGVWRFDKDITNLKGPYQILHGDNTLRLDRKWQTYDNLL
jgi:hypothetical protein